MDEDENTELLEINFGDKFSDKLEVAKDKLAEKIEKRYRRTKYRFKRIWTAIKHFNDEDYEAKLHYKDAMD